MRIVLFCHSLVSDWNHGNAHFLRGVAAELLARGHRVKVYEPRDAWSVQNLLAEHGPEALRGFHKAYPHLTSTRYALESLDLDAALRRADLVIAQEWNEPALIDRLGRHRRRHNSYRLLFHDTHHRSVSAPEQMARYDLRHYDGVLAFGNVVRDIYLDKGWARRAWTWHEAADSRVFRPVPTTRRDGDLIWVGNWGDEERTEELREFLLAPVRRLGLRARVHGVRYPETARQMLTRAGIEYAGWLPNFEAPAVFSRFAVTVHVPRRPYVQALPGIPTIRPFEAMACGLPLVCSPWDDAEGLFTPGEDYLVARTGREMRSRLRTLLESPSAAAAMARRARRTILARHTCAHRVDELLSIAEDLGLDPAPDRARVAAAP